MTAAARRDAPGATTRRPAWAGPATAAAVAGAATAYTALVDPNRSGAFPQCITRRLTGLDCPMCGGLRAVHALSRGDLGGAIGHNAVVVVALPLVVAAWLWWSARAVGARPPAVRWPRWAPWATLAVLVAFTVVRNTGWAGVGWLDSA